MKRSDSSDFDLEFLSDPSRWGESILGVRRCHVKTRDSKGLGGTPSGFGVVIDEEPLTVYEMVRPGGTRTWVSVTYESIAKLVAVWTVD